MEKIGISERVFAYQLFDMGLELEEVKQALKEVKQPTPGYYNAEDIFDYKKKINKR